MEWMLMPIRRYADFQGRSRRKEYWMFVLLQIITLVVFGMLIAIVGAESGLGTIVLWLGVLIYIGAFFLPSIAVQVRRFHDQDKTGWLILLGLIPYVGGIIMLVFMCLEGTRGPNRFGDDPKSLSPAEVFS